MAVQFFKLGNPFWGKQVCATRQNLPELDKSRTQFFSGQPYLNRGLKTCQVCRVFQMNGVTGFFQAVCQTQSPNRVAKTMTH